ncbi:hypothetical protein [Streptomyces sp. NBC_00859]|uniref:hypothetical protein n=1 Tax=Streptomyces sp. NBC_00859 TaxID=2903682 RepID=UPI00386A6820|nr:hypothetical protein OG584_03165 [Streptomyces sp. NBC_00859]
MRFIEHLLHLAERALTSIPAADADDIYAVSFLIDNEDDDPRQPTLTIGYNTEAQARCSIQDASDRAEARWNYAFWIQNRLAVVGDLTHDVTGATARQAWITEHGLWYVEPTDPAERDSAIGPLAGQIEALFNHTCCRIARTLHATGVIERSVGRPLPVIVHELEYYEAIARQTEGANPPGLADEFTSWVRNG